MLPGDRLACLLLEPLAVGDRFRQWPLHVTIVPWFRVAGSSDQLGRGLARALATVQPFEVGAGEAARFGPRQRLVRLLEASAPLIQVEQKSRRYLHKKRAWLVDETTKRHYDFRPHVTAQAGQALGPQAVLRFERLYIVEQKDGNEPTGLPEMAAGSGLAGSRTRLDSFPPGNYKEIVSEVCFGKTTA